MFYTSGLAHPGYSNFGKIFGEYDEVNLFFKIPSPSNYNCINLFLESPLFGVGPKI